MLNLQLEDGDNMLLRNIGKFLSGYTASHSRTQQSYLRFLCRMECFSFIEALARILANVFRWSTQLQMFSRRFLTILHNSFMLTLIYCMQLCCCRVSPTTDIRRPTIINYSSLNFLKQSRKQVIFHVTDGRNELCTF
jgi:hypothetical protein